MATVSGSSSFSTGGAAGRGMSGLVSGLDTEGMIEGMLSGTQGKIDKATAERQQVTWKQQIYRDLIAEINSFQSSFFGNGSSSLGSVDFFNSMSAITAAKAFSVVASSSAAAGKTSVSVGQLATASKIQSGASVSGALSGKIDQTAFRRELVLDVDGTEVKVNLTEVPKVGPDGKDLTDKQRNEKLVEQLNAEGGALKTAGITAEIDTNGALVFTKADSEISVSSKSSKLGLSMVGLAAGQKSKDGVFKGAANANAAVNFNMTLNGITKTIRMEGLSEASTYDEIQSALEKEINSAFGSGWVKTSIDTSGNLTMTTNGKGNVVSIEGDQSGLKLLGVTAGESNKIAMGQMLKDVNFGTALQGSEFAFTINGVNFSFSGEKTLSDVVKAVNNSKAGVRIVYSDIEDKFTIESSSTGAGFDINFSQSEGNLLNAMFGKGTVDKMLSTGSKASSKELVTEGIQSGTRYGTEFKYGNFAFTADGNAYSINLPQKEDKSAYTEEELYKAINQGLADRLGYVDEGGVQKQAVEMVAGADGKVEMVVRNGMKIAFDDLSKRIPGFDAMSDADKKTALDEAAKNNATFFFGFNDTNNILKADATGKVDGADVALSTLGLPDKLTIGSTEVTTVSGLLTALKDTYGVDATFENGKIKLDSKGAAIDVILPDELSSFFGATKLELGRVPTEGGVSDFTNGQNAIARINGVTVERSSNTFNVNGLTISLTETTGDMIGQLEAVKDAGGAITGWKDKNGATYTVDATGRILNDKGKVAELFAGLTLDADGYLIDEEGKRAQAVLGGDETITTTRNTNSIYDGVKSFVDKYNALIEKLNKLTDAEPTYKKYPPLTAAQKKDMSEREVELWEEKAKEGLLRKDSNLESFLTSMRSILYTKPEGSYYALYDIVIDTSTEWKDKGKLIIDESKLKTTIESNPQALQELFTGPNGLATQLNDTIKRTANTNSSTPGTLVALAGVEGKASSLTNTLTKRVQEINTQLKTLQSKYEREKARYWRQFNSMEKALGNLSNQSGWLTQQFSQ